MRRAVRGMDRLCTFGRRKRGTPGSLHRAVASLLFVVSTSLLAAIAPQPARVVILTGADPSQPAVFVQIKGLRDQLEKTLPQGAEVYLDSLDGFRFGADDLTPEFLALMTKKYSNQHVDLVISIGNHATDFALKYHERIWPGAPVLFSSVPEEWFVQHPLPDGFARVPFHIDITRTLAIAEKLQPGAHRLVVIGGTTDTDYSFIDRIVKAASRRAGRWTAIEDWQGMSLPEITRRLAQLDAGTAVIYTTMYRDSEGHRYFPYQIVPRLVAASRAPIYAWYSTYLGGGITAGAVYDFEENARLTAYAALAILRNARGVEGLTFAALPARCTANVTQLQRYGLSASALSDDCQLIDYPKSIFREYRGVVLIALTVLLAQTFTIVALLTQRRSRRVAEAEAITRRGELARAARFATVGELSASIAHEVGQPLGAILSNADAAELLVKASQLDVEELSDILADVKRDALRANDVVQRLRSLLQKQGIVFSPLVLDATLQCALTLIDPEAKRRSISVETSFGAAGAQVLGDAVQIQQIVLNLTINAMDAMQETAQLDRILSLATRLTPRGIEFTVTDRGCGIGTASAQRLFEPFYTTKTHGMGLGLSIVRSIVDAHHGRIEVAARSGGGTIFIVWLPFAPDTVTAANVELRQAANAPALHHSGASTQRTSS